MSGDRNSDRAHWDQITHPVVIDDRTVFLLQVLTCDNNISDIWTAEYVDYLRQSKRGARELVSRMADHCSVNMLWDLREALAAQITDHNIQFGSTHPIDRPNTGSGE